MGLFSGISKAIGNIAGGAIGGKTGELIKQAGSGGGGNVAPVDPYEQQRKRYIEALEAQRKKISGVASEYEKSMPGMKERAFGAAADVGRKEVGQEIGNIRKGTQRRGLLYSGLREGAEAGAVGDMQSRVASQQSQIADEMENRRQELQDAAAQAGLGKMAAEAGLASGDINMTLQNALARRQAMGSLLGGIGGLAGAYIGSKK